MDFGLTAPNQRRLDWPTLSLYILSVSLLVAHGIDSTRFAEWRLFDIPQWLYVLSYLPFTAFFLFGFIFLVNGDRRGYGMSLFVGLLTASVIVLHLPQLLGGEVLFHTVESVMLLVACGLAGLGLIGMSSWRLGEADGEALRRRR